MFDSGRRRGFLSSLALGMSGAALAVGTSKTAAAAGANEPKGEKKYSGTSKSGDQKEALDNAIKAAIKGSGVVDAQVKWTLHEVSGVSGGIAGLHQVTVTIEVKVS